MLGSIGYFAEASDQSSTKEEFRIKQRDINERYQDFYNRKERIENQRRKRELAAEAHLKSESSMPLRKIKFAKSITAPNPFQIVRARNFMKIK